MSTQNDGGPAFPRPIGQVQDGVGGKWNSPYPGMTLRDYFAAKAMHGILCADTVSTARGAAEESYRFADAMLEARKEKAK